jgi:hypothetical protein
MAKAPTSTQAHDPQLPTVTAGAAGAAPPAFLQAQIVADAGRGTSQAAEDNLIPLVYVLQGLSPQINRRGPDYIDGAKDGDFWLKGTKTVFDGDEGFLFQPCYFDKDWVEWVPRIKGGGLVGRYPTCPDDAVETEVESDDKPGTMQKKMVRPNGNEMIETRYHVGYVILPDGSAMPYVIPFKSTGHTVSKQWMVLMNSKQVPGGSAPSWACLYRLTTKQRTNAAGTWNVIEVQDAGWVQTQAEYDRGQKLNAQMAAGEKAIDTDDAAPADPAPAGNDGAM